MLKIKGSVDFCASAKQKLLRTLFAFSNFWIKFRAWWKLIWNFNLKILNLNAKIFWPRISKYLGNENSYSLPWIMDHKIDHSLLILLFHAISVACSKPNIMTYIIICFHSKVSRTLLVAFNLSFEDLPNFSVGKN